MDVQRPIPRQRLSADWGRAVADAIAAGRMSGDGVLRTPVGTSTAPTQPPAVSAPPPPGERFAAWVASDGEGGHVLRVRKGALRDPSRGGAELEYAATDFTDGGDWWEAALPEGGATAAAVADGDGGWTLRLGDGGDESDSESDGGETEIWPIAVLGAANGYATPLTQLRTGDISIGGSGIHFGDAEDASAVDTWNVADGKPAILKLADADGNVIAKVLVDSRGNVVSWEAAGDGGEPADPAPKRPAPPCGNPLNDTSSSDDNPLDGGGGGGGPADDRNPLNDVGDGGYTPECDMEAS